MTSDTSKPEPKQIYIKAFTSLWQLENAVRDLNGKDLAAYEISILGKTKQFNRDTDRRTTNNTNFLEAYWKKTLYHTVSFANLFNPQLGNIFVVGTLASTFLYQLDGKTLGMLSAGPYGILRGIGATEAQVLTHLQMLTEGKYLLIFRGTDAVLEDYKRTFEKK